MRFVFSGVLGASLLLCGAAVSAPVSASKPADVLNTYSDIAHAAFEDSLITGKALQASVNALIADPTTAKLAAARASWKAARVPYLQSEAFRFGNAVVDKYRAGGWDVVSPKNSGPNDLIASNGHRYHFVRVVQLGRTEPSEDFNSFIQNALSNSAAQVRVLKRLSPNSSAVKLPVL